MYKTTKVKWAAPPEVAHIKDLLPTLVATEEATRIINILNGAEEVGDGESKSKRDLGYAEYWEIEIDCRLLNPIIGSQPDSPWMRHLVRKSGVKAPKECDLRFWRDEKSGEIMIPSDVVCGYLRGGVRFGLNKGDVIAKYLAADDIHIDVPEVFQVELPVISDNKGSGLTTYELVPKGTQFTMRLRIPAKGISDPKSFILWLAAYAPRPCRGISPARGKRFGKFEVVDYKIGGCSYQAANALTAVLNSVESPEAKRLYTKLLAEAEQNQVDFRKVGGGKGDLPS